MKNPKKLLLWGIPIAVILCVALIAAVLLAHRPIKAETPAGMYSWADYQKMSLEEQDAFREQFPSMEDFEAWRDLVNPPEDTSQLDHWDKFGKKPDQYTWKEYQSLSGEDKEAFYQWFASPNEFEAWMDSVKPEENTSEVEGWNKPGKLPDEYTWAEYQALTPAEQEAFFRWFASSSEFETWMESVKPKENASGNQSWDKSGKLPKDYTWNEYQALTPEEQDAFFLWFASTAEFEAWMDSVKPEENTSEVEGWHKPGKLPNEYTWAEYQALTPMEQDAFFLWFASTAQFEAWMDSVKPEENTSEIENWNKPGKLPNEYTWAEYQALTPEEQEAFYQWFASMEAFEAWMDEVTEE